MSEKVDFNGDVGQAVMGDVKEAPRLSNVVNLNLHEVEKEDQRITDYQRKRINVLVKEWAALCGDKEIEIYKIFIADFGIRKFRELPIEHYLTVKETLEGWISRAAKPTDAPSVSLMTNSIQHEPVFCAACAEKKTNYIRLQRMSAVLVFILCCSLAFIGWLLYRMPVSSAASVQAIENKCLFDGKAYSPGSTVRNVTGHLQECAVDDFSSQVRWMTPRRAR